MPETLSNFGLALQAVGRYSDDAIAKCLEALPQARPDYLKPRVQLATLLAASGRIEEAVPHILEAVRLEPTSAQWRYFAGLMLAEAGRTSDAIEMLRSALAVDPNHADARQALRELGDK